MAEEENQSPQDNQNSGSGTQGSQPKSPASNPTQQLFTPNDEFIRTLSDVPLKKDKPEK